MKAPILLRIPWMTQQAMTAALVEEIRHACQTLGVDYDSTAHWNVESMTASPEGLVVCVAFFGVPPRV